MRGRYTGGIKVIHRKWVKELMVLESFTQNDAAVTARRYGIGTYGPDLINRLRTAPELNLIVLGPAGPPHHHRAKRYRLERREHAPE